MPYLLGYTSIQINHKRVNKVKKELPVGMILLWFMDRGGFEPPTRRLKAAYSDQLSYPSKCNHTSIIDLRHCFASSSGYAKLIYVW